MLKWSEMKKMGGKKADGLSNVNYNEIQKNILSEVSISQAPVKYDQRTKAHEPSNFNKNEIQNNLLFEVRSFL